MNEEKKVIPTKPKVRILEHVSVFECIMSVIGIIFFVCLFTWHYNKTSSLKKNQEYVNAVIYELTRCNGYKYNKYNCYKYNYIVDGINYSGRETLLKKDILSVGDTIIVVYDKTDPENNKSKRNFEHKWLQPRKYHQRSKDY